MYQSSDKSSLLTALKYVAGDFVRLPAVLVVVPLCFFRTVPARRLTLVICLCFTATTAGRAAERTWADTEDNRIEGRYIRVRDNVVVIQASDKTYRIPYGNLSIADQEYVHFRRLGRNERNRTMREIMSRDERMWQTSSSQEVAGRFYRYIQGHVSICADDDFQSIAYGDLTPDDRNYVRATLKALGLASQLPDDRTEYNGLTAIRPTAHPDGLQDTTEPGSSHHGSADENSNENDVKEIDEQEFYDQFMAGRSSANRAAPERKPPRSRRRPTSPKARSSRVDEASQETVDATVDVGAPHTAVAAKEALPTTQEASDDIQGHVRRHGGLLLFILVIAVIVLVFVKMAMN